MSQGFKTTIQLISISDGILRFGRGRVGRAGRRRYNLIENLQSQQLLPFRDALYTYYRLGLDNFAGNPQQVRKQTLDMLTMLRTVTLQKPGAVLLNSFFDAKADELTNILYEGTPNERKRAFDLLSQLDPGQTEGYRRLLR